MEKIRLEAIKKLPHTYCEDMQGRMFPLHVLYEESKWHLWFPDNGALKEFQPVDLVEGNYYAKNIVDVNDILFSFLEFLNKRASWPRIQYLVEAVTSDINNLSSSIEKIEILLKENKSSGKDIRRMVGTELEYIFITCRCLFDLLQKIIADLWKRTDIKGKGDLPRSFAKIALKGEDIVSIKDIVDKYLLPLELAKIYHLNAPFFQWLRYYRGRIEHHGDTFDLIFITDKGPLIDTHKLPFNKMPIWVSTNMVDENLGSVKSVISYIIFKTLNAFNLAVDFFKTEIRFPADVVPNHNMYTRGIYNKHLINIEDHISNPW